MKDPGREPCLGSVEAKAESVPSRRGRLSRAFTRMDTCDVFAAMSEAGVRVFLRNAYFTQHWLPSRSRKAGKKSKQPAGRQGASGSCLLTSRIDVFRGFKAKFTDLPSLEAAKGGRVLKKGLLFFLPAGPGICYTAMERHVRPLPCGSAHTQDVPGRAATGAFTEVSTA